MISSDNPPPKNHSKQTKETKDLPLEASFRDEGIFSKCTLGLFNQEKGCCLPIVRHAVYVSVLFFFKRKNGISNVVMKDFQTIIPRLSAL